jgi:hypothetical protein
LNDAYRDWLEESQARRVGKCFFRHFLIGRRSRKALPRFLTSQFAISDVDGQRKNAILFRNIQTLAMAQKQTSRSVGIVPLERIEQKIYLLRGHKVMFDSDLAALYQVPTKAFNQAVQRNLDRFPDDFMFQLSKGELENWRSQIVTSNPAAKMGLRRPPYAFTEHGVAMLSSVLRSKRAVQMNILIIRAFVKLRELLASHKDLARKIEALDRQQKEHGQQLAAVYDVVKQLINPPPKPKRRMGFIDRDQKDEGDGQE